MSLYNFRYDRAGTAFKKFYLNLRLKPTSELGYYAVQIQNAVSTYFTQSRYCLLSLRRIIIIFALLWYFVQREGWLQMRFHAFHDFCMFFCDLCI